MRRWHLGLASVATLSLVAAAGIFLSRGSSPVQAQEAGPQPSSKLAKSRIDKVTVYPNTALVTREVDIPAGNGLVELVVSPMPEQIVPSTMYSEGSEGLRVLTTRFATRQVMEDTSEARRKLAAEKEKLDVVAAKINSDIANVMKNVETLSRLEVIPEKNKHTGDEAIAIVKYIMEQRAERSKDLVVLQEQKRQNDILIQFNQRKLAELGSSGGRVEREAVIVVDREAGKGGKVRLNYLVGSVAWHPEYKVRAGKLDEDVRIDYLANLMQHSGEDWNQVKLTLSTAQPMLNASPPELCMLQPVLVARGAPGGPPMPGGGGFASPFANTYGAADGRKKAMESRTQAAQINAGQFGQLGGGGGAPGVQQPTGGPAGGAFHAQKEADALLNSAAAIEQNFELMQTRQEVLDRLKRKSKDDVTDDGPSVTFHLPNKLSVPSRGDEQVVEVVKLNLAPKYYYKTVPVLNARVYRLADLVNKSEHILLPGEATMYQGTDFVGRMPMPLVAVGEEFTAGFGVDTQLQVQRQMIDQTRTTQGGNQVLKYDYRILVNSFKNEPVKVQVWDRLPKGENESVGVVLLKSSPELCKDGIYVRESRPNNLLRWDVEVPANVSGEKAFAITYEFKMELDRQMAITGFTSK